MQNVDNDPWTPRCPDWSERVRNSFARQPFMALLQASLQDLAPGRAVIEVDYRPELTQQHGFFHGGLSGAIADSAGGYAAFTLFPADSSVLTVEYKLNLIAPARGERLRAIGEVVRSGRTLTFCNLRLEALEAGRTTLCGTGQQTLICLGGQPDDRRRFGT